MAGVNRIVGMGAGVPSASIALAITREQTGAAVAIHFSEPADSDAVWTFQVEVQTEEGARVLETFTTRPPSGGDPPSRTVALCYCPGATDWRLVPFGPPDAPGEVTLSTTKFSNDGTFALVPVNGSRLVDRVFPPPVFAVPQGVLSSGPGTLMKLWGFVDPAQPLTYLGVVDKDAPVAGGDHFLVAPVQLLATSGANFSFSWEPDGIPFTQQIRWAASSTQDPITLGPAATVSGEVR